MLHLPLCLAMDKDDTFHYDTFRYTLSFDNVLVNISSSGSNLTNEFKARISSNDIWFFDQSPYKKLSRVTKSTLNSIFYFKLTITCS